MTVTVQCFYINLPTGNHHKSTKFNVPFEHSNGKSVSRDETEDPDDKSYYSFSNKTKLPATAIRLEHLPDIVLSKEHRSKQKKQFEVHVHASQSTPSHINVYLIQPVSPMTNTMS